MDDFARLMAREGVIKNTDNNSKHKDIVIPPPPQKVVETHAVNSANSDEFAYKWAMGSEAKKTAETAIERFKHDKSLGIKPFFTIIRENGTAIASEKHMPLSEIIAKADKERIRLIIICGKGWTAIFHPLMGTATIEEDPVGDP